MHAISLSLLPSMWARVQARVSCRGVPAAAVLRQGRPASQLASKPAREPTSRGVFGVPAGGRVCAHVRVRVGVCAGAWVEVIECGEPVQQQQCMGVRARVREPR
eukprot:351955-Chlamydomonas_euryale.AAC.1